ncbi:MAG TPA: PQQ-binding-like beta-propeller repeat protein [Pyrinomonadaceae bacterium]|nr:PQQ-binding-like beta-propeller repeat protein [Pyrinomonadaceae bacterium]
MFCAGRVCVLVLTMVTILVGAIRMPAQTQLFPSQIQNNSQANSTVVHLHWGSRAGVSRYRLQLARDREFGDIVFDRVVNGNEFEIADLPPGRYFWRIAPLAAMNAADGKIIWQAAAGADVGAVAFADVNGDGVLDVLMAGGETFAFALSGDDGSVVWKQDEQSAMVANHAAAPTARSVVAVPFGSGILLIAGDTFRARVRG